MPVTAKPLHPHIGAEIGGVDLTRPLDAATVREIVAAIDKHAVLVFRNDPPLDDAQHLALGRALGPLQRLKMLTMLAGKDTRLSTTELIDVGNLDETGEILADSDRRRAFQAGNLLWHTDVSFDANRAVYSLLAAHAIPPSGGDTEYADMRAAYDALDPAMKGRLDGLVCEHSIWYSRALGGLTEVSEAEKATRPPARHLLVHVHPSSGRKALYLASHASHIVGMPFAEGRKLLDELTAFATQERFVYRHKWRVGDIVMWDNLATMHRGTKFDDKAHKRDMRRVTTLEHEAA